MWPFIVKSGQTPSWHLSQTPIWCNKHTRKNVAECGHCFGHFSGSRIRQWGVNIHSMWETKKVAKTKFFLKPFCNCSIIYLFSSYFKIINFYLCTSCTKKDGHMDKYILSVYNCSQSVDGVNNKRENCHFFCQFCFWEMADGRISL